MASSTSESTQSREIRVFLSSTFRDMEAERSHLVKQVFPKVRAACLARQVGFTEIDLRWGVTEEESKNGATVEICLKEIDRCRDFPPFFIGFLGERYGWIPRHEDLAAYWHKHIESEYAQSIQQAIKRGISVTELEMELAVLGSAIEPAALRPADRTDHAIFCLRAKEFSETLYVKAQYARPPAKEADFFDPADGRLEALKERIRESSLLGLDNYASIEDFGAKIEAHLLAALDRYFPASAAPSAAKRREAAHAAFRYQRLQNFLPRLDIRETVISAIAERLAQPTLGPILLCGPSGQGKSAVLADLAQYIETNEGDVHYRVIDHYIGADDANNLDAWILRLLERLHPEINSMTGPIPDSTKDRKEALSTWLGYAARQSECQASIQGAVAPRVRFVLLLDALDQLSDCGKDLHLLNPETLGPDAILVASAADSTLVALNARFTATIRVPPLDDNIRAALVRDTLKRFQKALPEDDARRLARAAQSGSPLFLTLALEELRVDAHHETLGELVTDILQSPDAEQLFLNNFLLDPDYARPNQPDLAVRFMALIGASHAGLTENELADLLALRTDPVAEDTQKSRLPQKYMSNLLAIFNTFLLDKSGRRAPMHRIFGVAALNHLGEHAVREQIYAHFRPGYGDSPAEFKVRDAAEALYQATRTSNDVAGKKRLENDLAHLHVPAKLIASSESIVADALHEFSFEEVASLAERWRGSVTRFAEMATETIDGSIGNFAVWLSERIGNYSAARALQEPLFDVHRRILGKDHPDTLGAMSNLASTLGNLNDLPAARTLEEQILEANRRILGEDHPDTLSAMNNLAVTLRAQGDLPGMHVLLEKVLMARRRIEEDQPNTLDAMRNLAVTLRAQGALPDAQVVVRQMMEARYRIEEDHPNMLTALSNFGVALGALGDLPGARTQQETVLEARRRILGEDHPDTVSAMANLAVTLHAQGDLLEARTQQERVLEARCRILGRDHPDTLSAMTNLAVTLRAQGDLPGSLTLQEQALLTSRRILGEEHPDTLVALNNVALTLGAQSDLAIRFGDKGDLSGARMLEESVLEASRRILGEEHPDTFSAMTNLAMTLRVQGDLLGARTLQESVLEAVRRISGEDHPNTLNIMTNLANTLADQGDLLGARTLEESVLETRRRILEKDHPDTLSIMTNLAITSWAMADYEAARELAASILEIKQRLLGDEDEDVLAASSNLATALDQLNRHKEANILRNHVCAIRRRIAERE